VGCYIRVWAQKTAEVKAACWADSGMLCTARNRDAQGGRWRSITSNAQGASSRSAAPG